MPTLRGECGIDVRLHLGQAILDDRFRQSFRKEVPALLLGSHPLILMRPFGQGAVLYFTPVKHRDMHVYVHDEPKINAT